MSVQPSTLIRRPAAETVDNRIIAMMRLVLALSAVLITYIDPSEPDRHVAITYAALNLYAIYSAALYFIAQRQAALQQSVSKWAHWVDVGWYVVFIGLSSGTSSIFFFFFFFAILVASFRWGLKSGLHVVLVSAILFTVVGYVTAPAGPRFELNRFLLRPIYLFVLGYMMAYWGGFEITLKRRLALLKEVNTLANPRFGVDRTTGIVMERVRTFYHADACLSITIDPHTGEYRMRRADGDDPEGAARVKLIPPELARQLLAPPAEALIVYRGRPRGWLRSKGGWHAHDIKTGKRVSLDQAVSERLAATLDAGSFVSIPLYYNHNPFGRLYLTAARQGAFDDSDADFLLQVSVHITPILDNIRLVDRLASDAAEEERRKIARDLHDSVIQPYIGLQMGLIGLRKKLASGGNIAGDLDGLIDLSTEAISDMRGYARDLKSSGEHEGSLPAALRRFAGKFTAATGIEVQIDAAADLHLNDRLAAEIFQLVAEGLSNVRRHTQATRATISLQTRGDFLLLKIEDEGTNGSMPEPFLPRSIAERTRSLGGQSHVERRADGGSIVAVNIPL